MMTETTIQVTPASQDNAAKQDAGASGGLSWIRINLEYFRTIPGILKLVQVLFGIICMSCASPARLAGTHWFLFVVVTTFIATLIWVFLYLLGIREALKLPIDWLLTELLNTSIATILYTIAFIVQLCSWTPAYRYFRDSNLTAGAFGLFNTIAYGAGAYFLYVEWKSSRSN